jgi:hypothetical protein
MRAMRRWWYLLALAVVSVTAVIAAAAAALGNDQRPAHVCHAHGMQPKVGPGRPPACAKP